MTKAARTAVRGVSTHTAGHRTISISPKSEGTLCDATIVRIAAQVGWEVARDPATSTYVGICESLNLNAAGNTMQDFIECANEAKAVLFDILISSGEFEAFLQERGWSYTGQIGKTRRVDIPFSIEQTGRLGDLVAPA